MIIFIYDKSFGKIQEPFFKHSQLNKDRWTPFSHSEHIFISIQKSASGSVEVD